MATITIRNLGDDLKAQLRVVAARNGHSMEEEVRVILRDALRQGQADQAKSEHAGLGSRIRAHFAREGGVELELPARRERPRAPDLRDAD